MARALSDDLRERVVAAVEAGDSRREVCVRFGVSYSSANNNGYQGIGSRAL